MNISPVGLLYLELFLNHDYLGVDGFLDARQMLSLDFQ